MMIMIALGLGVFVGFHMEWVSIRENTNRCLMADIIPMKMCAR